ncbi:MULTISPECIES: hypothetical protein [unclassified Helicobacter]|uniref:hypothetical protein n=1 Tax=unclassified Helicobacter TaxID=2593540 RepID=UPI0011C05DF1|nr:MULTISPECIES: hypothetical protein [unclassified Helicobacter]
MDCFAHARNDRIHKNLKPPNSVTESRNPINQKTLSMRAKRSQSGIHSRAGDTINGIASIRT